MLRNRCITYWVWCQVKTLYNCKLPPSVHQCDIIAFFRIHFSINLYRYIFIGYFSTILSIYFYRYKFIDIFVSIFCTSFAQLFPQVKKVFHFFHKFFHKLPFFFSFTFSSFCTKTDLIFCAILLLAIPCKVCYHIPSKTNPTQYAGHAYTHTHERRPQGGAFLPCAYIRAGRRSPW